MKANVSFSRPVGVWLVLGGIAAVGTFALSLAAANLDALTSEREAKSGFVARSLSARREADAAPDAPAADLAVGADSATRAAAQIDALVREAIVGAGGVVLSSRAEAKGADPEATPDERIEVQAAVRGTMDALQAGLYRLESGHPLVLVDLLDIQPADEGDQGGRAAATPVLTATLTLSAYWEPPKP